MGVPGITDNYNKFSFQIAQQNVQEMELPNIDFVHCDLLDLFDQNQQKFDTILINPPFGTKKNAGIDMKFLQIGIKLAKTVVYSLHKSSTRDYIQKKCKEFNVKGKVLAELRYNLEKSYKFHRKNSVDVEVDFWRFEIV